MNQNFQHSGQAVLPPLRLDEKDRRLLVALDHNARASLTFLSRQLRMPVETVRYRIQRLLSTGIIKNFLAVIDGGRLGFYYYKVFLRLHNVREQLVQQLITELVQDPRICWVIRIDGNFDLGFTPRVSNPLEQSILMDQLRWKYARYIRRWTLSVNIRMDFYARDFLVDTRKRPIPKGTYTVRTSPFPLDSLAQNVLEHVAREPRAHASDIGRSLGVSVDSVLDRMKLLERNKVIVRYALVTNIQLLNQVSFYVLIYLNEANPQREQQFVQFCAEQPNIIYLIKSLGEWDYELSVEAASIRDYRTLMMRMTREFSDIIQEYNGMMVYEIAKYVYP